MWLRARRERAAVVLTVSLVAVMVGACSPTSGCDRDGEIRIGDTVEVEIGFVGGAPSNNIELGGYVWSPAAEQPESERRSTGRHAGTARLASADFDGLDVEYGRVEVLLDSGTVVVYDGPLSCE